MAADWINRVRDELERLGRDGGWADRAGGSARAEPTALAGLALRAAGGPQGLAAEAARRLACWQRPDGSVGVMAGTDGPGWPTPLAALLWANAGGHDGPARLAAGWLLLQRGKTLPSGQDGALGHDTTLVGWPWVEGTHSWVEPTALAVLALRRLGRGDHPRVAEGLRLLRNRAIVGGGWNYGNSSTFGRHLRPQPAPTGLALLALAGDGPPDRAVREALSYLEGALVDVRAASSLGWGLLGLRAWGRAPAWAEAALAEAHARLAGRDDAAPRLALLLLAASGPALPLFGPALQP